MDIPKFLQDHHIRFGVLNHDRTYSAQRLAAAVHVRGDEVAKTVLLCTDDDEHILAVVPAAHNVDLDRVRAMLGVVNIELAPEWKCRKYFRDCELGALPPFGFHYGLSTIMDKSLMKDDEIVFEGNNHRQAIRMKRADYMALEAPIVGSFSRHC